MTLAADAITPLIEYGFIHPKGYTPQNRGNYIHTKRSRNPSNITTGNWESEYEFKLLPMKPIPKMRRSEEDKDLPQAEVSKRLEKEATELTNIISYLDEWAPWYRHNLFGYMRPEVFTPTLPGYLHNTKQICVATYTLTGKLFLWAMIALACGVLKSQGYFKNVKIDENPRSLNNRLNDHFYRHTYKNEAVKTSTTGSHFVKIGLLLVIIGSVGYVILGVQAANSTRHAIDNLGDGLEKMMSTAKAAGPLVDKINTMNILVPRGIRFDDTLRVKNSLGAYKMASIVNVSFERFRKLVNGASYTKPMFMVLILLFACLIAVGSMVGIKENFMGVNFCGFFFC
jgi:hypothetical protein